MIPWAAGAALILCMATASQAAGPPRQATLTIERDFICTYPNFVDHQVSTDRVEFLLPEVDGPVSGQGQYTHRGTGYVLSGASAGAGHVRGDRELVLTYGQWNYNGEWMPSEAPGVPTQARPVVLPLEPGAQTTVSFQNEMAHEGASCSGTAIYRIDFERETQVWDIALDGFRILLHRTFYSLVDPATQARSSFDYEHGVTFTYELGARVWIERRAGAWHYKQGQVMRAAARHSYQQNPQLYTILAHACTTCWKVAGLAGAAIGGDSDGSVLTLYWPDIRPEVRIDSRFALQCAPGDHYKTCERGRAETLNYSDEDGDFLQRATGHDLKLRDGPQDFDTGTDDAGMFFQVRHDYRLKRVK